MLVHIGERQAVFTVSPEFLFCVLATIQLRIMFEKLLTESLEHVNCVSNRVKVLLVAEHTTSNVR